MPCSPVQTDGWLRGTCCLHQQGSVLLHSVCCTLSVIARTDLLDIIYRPSFNYRRRFGEFNLFPSSGKTLCVPRDSVDCAEHTFYTMAKGDLSLRNVVYNSH